MASWQEHVKTLEQELFKLKFPDQPAELYDPIQYTLSLGGKRIRPALCLMASEMYSSKNEAAMHAALAVEIFHNFTLVHDDIMDEAPLRRGKASVHQKWNRDIAILSGDVMFVKAIEQIALIDGKYLSKALQLFNRTAVEVCEGQQMDMNFEDRRANLSEYLKMIELKTAVLLACSLQMGAMVNDASEEDQKALYEFGRNIGIAFQIQDDYLDAFGDAQQFGKQRGGDIISNKKTYLLLKAFEIANEEQKEELNRAKNIQETNLKVETFLKIFSEIDVPGLTKKAISHYSTIAMNSLESISLGGNSTKELSKLANQLMERTY